MNTFEGIGCVIAASTLIAYADRDLFENHEASLMFECFAVNQFARHGAAAKLTDVSEKFFHGLSLRNLAHSDEQITTCFSKPADGSDLGFAIGASSMHSMSRAARIAFLGLYKRTILD